jgi:chromosome segregation ATPase
LTTDLQATQATVTTVQSELASLSQENASLDTQLSQLRLENQQKNEQDSSDVVALTRELRELRGDLERVRMEREEWEEEAGREREKRERLEEERRGMERKMIEAEERRNAAEDGWRREEKRASNLEEVLGEFQGGKMRSFESASTKSGADGQLRDGDSQGLGDRSGYQRAGESTSVCRFFASRIQIASCRCRGKRPHPYAHSTSRD